MSPCLEARQVTALLAGELERAERDQVDEHIDGCVPCRRWLATAARDHVARSTARDAERGPSSTDETVPASVPARIALAPGARVGRYVVRDFLGQGAMGVVYEAHDPQLDRSIALKVVRAGADGASQARAARFVREAQAMARVSHPNVVPIYDAGQTDEVVFLAMKRVEGASLRRYLASSGARLTASERRRLVCGAGRGLAAAHAAGIVHSDFKPDNVLVGSDGVAQVADFGLAVLGSDADRRAPGDDDTGGAHVVERDGFETATDAILGTPAYMAPEVKRGARADALADQYSFAVTAAEVLGAKPPRRIQRALQRAMADAPARRFSSIDELVAVLERRPIAPLVALGLAAIAVAAGVAWAAWPSRDAAASCEVVTNDRVNDVYGPIVRATLAARLGTLPGLHLKDAEAALARLDDYATSWGAKRRESCRARTHQERSPELVDLEMACLDEKLDTLGVVTRTLGSLDRPDAAPRVAGMLGSLEACTDPAGLRARAAADRVPARTRALRVAMFEAHAQLQQGHAERASPVFDRVLDEAKRERLPIIEAEALLARATLLAQTGKPGANDGFHAALAIAEKLGDTALRVDALIALLADAAVDRARASEVELLAKLIETHLAELPGPQRSRRGRVAANLANYHAARREFPAAERAADDAARLFAEEIGPVHPYTLMSRETKAHIQSIQGHHDKAIAITREVLADLRRTYGESHPLVAHVQLSEGVYLAHAQRLDEAAASFAQALAINERIYGPSHPRVADVLRKIGYLALERDPKLALTSFHRAVAIYARAKLDGPQLAPLLTGLGEAQLLTGDFSAAVKTLEAALASWGESQVASHLLPTAKFALARARWNAGEDRARARALAAEARTEYLENQGPWRIKADEVAKWLATRK